MAKPNSNLKTKISKAKCIGLIKKKKGGGFEYLQAMVNGRRDQTIKVIIQLRGGKDSRACGSYMKKGNVLNAHKPFQRLYYRN